MRCERSRARDRRSRTGRWPIGLVLIGGGLSITMLQAWADPQPVTVNGLPEQVVPTFAEIGLGSYTPPSTGTTVIGSTGSGTTGSGSGGATDAGDSTALTTMESESWGSVAASNATALGVNPSALAATCVIESGCQNVTGSGTVAGAFQMTSSTYTAALNAALMQDPALGTDITTGTAGQMDPATESIAAAEYLEEAATTLENAGIADPTVLDTRAIYNFGPQSGALLAVASSDTLISDAMPQVSAATLANNGITAGETVGEWRAAVTSKIGDAANQSVMTG